MSFKSLFVLGHTVEVEGTEALHLPYQFYGVKTIKFDKEEKDDVKKAALYKASEVFIVNIVMPIGGSQSALFRYPKEGEKVLCGVEENEYFLLGYMPENPSDNIFTGWEGTKTKTYEQVRDEEIEAKRDEIYGNDDLDELERFVEFNDAAKAIELKYEAQIQASNKEVTVLEESLDNVLPEVMAGQFFRYKGPDDYPSESASESSRFVNKQQFSEIGFYHDTTRWKRKGEENCPQIDILKLKSTGDIHQEAVNSNEIKAKRIEILANCDNDFDGKDDLFKGDLHIRAKNKVIIKAGDSITLKVGRSSITINDKGISISVNKINTKAPASWNSKVSLDAHNGVSISGPKFSANGTNGFSISEEYGGSIESALGIMRMRGIDIAILKNPSGEFLVHGIAKTLDLVKDLAFMSLGLLDKYGPEFGSTAWTWLGTANKVYGIGRGIAEKQGKKIAGTKPGHTYGAGDTAGFMMMQLNLINSIIDSVRSAAEACLPEKFKRLTWYYDSLFAAFAVAQFGMTEAVVLTIGASNLWTLNAASSIYMARNQITINTAKMRQLFKVQEESPSPLAGQENGKIIKGKMQKILEKALKFAPQAAKAGLQLGFELGKELGMKDYLKPINKEFWDELRSL